MVGGGCIVSTVLTVALTTGGLVTRADERTIENNRNLVRGWLLERNYSLEDKREAGQAWAIHATEHESAYTFAVSQQVGRPEFIAPAIRFVPHELQREIDALPAPERGDLIWNLKMRLLDFDVGFRLSEPFSSITFIDVIYTEELRRGTFFRRARLLQRAFMAAQWIIQRKFEVSATDAVN